MLKNVRVLRIYGVLFAVYHRVSLLAIRTLIQLRKYPNFMYRCENLNHASEAGSNRISPWYLLPLLVRSPVALPRPIPLEGSSFASHLFFKTRLAVDLQSTNDGLPLTLYSRIAQSEGPVCKTWESGIGPWGRRRPKTQHEPRES